MLSQFHRAIVDSVVDDLLASFFELPREEAIAALAALAAVPMMSADAETYPELPALFQQPIYQKIQSQLKLLCEIMYNRQPQNAARYSNDLSNDVNHGKFGFRSENGQNATAKDVHDYMRYKFSLAVNSVAVFEPLPGIIKSKNKDPVFKQRYYKYLAQWVRQPSGDPIPKEMEIIIKEAVAENHLDIETGELSINRKKAIKFLCSLSPNLFEPDMTPCLEKLFYKKLTDSAYQRVQKKLQEQVTDDGGKFSHLESVCLNFVTVIEAHEKILPYGDIIRSHDHALVDKVSDICQAYITHIENNSADKQIPLSEADIDALKQFISQADEFANEEKFNEWIGIFFAAYFESGNQKRIELENKIFNLALNRDKFFVVDDGWIVKTSQENINIQGEKVELSLTPYHVNLILLNALTTPVEKWSIPFHSLFSQVVNLLDSNDDNLWLTQALKMTSYPDRFRQQMHWLNDLYEVRANHNHDEDIDYRRRDEFPILYCLAGNDVKLIFNRLSIEQVNTAVEIFKDQLLDISKNLDALCHVISDLTVEQCQIFCKILKGKLSGIVKSPDDIHYMLNNISPTKCQVFCNSLKDDLTGIISGYSANIFYGLMEKKLPRISKENWNHFMGIIDIEFLRGNVVKSVTDIVYAKFILPRTKWDEFIKTIDIEFLCGLVTSVDSLDVLRQMLPEILPQAKFSDVIKAGVAIDIKNIPLQDLEILKRMSVDVQKTILTSTVEEYVKSMEFIDNKSLAGHVKDVNQLSKLKKILSEAKWDEFIIEAIDNNFLGNLPKNFSDLSRLEDILSGNQFASVMKAGINIDIGKLDISELNSWLSGLCGLRRATRNKFIESLITKTPKTFFALPPQHRDYIKKILENMHSDNTFMRTAIKSIFDSGCVADHARDGRTELEFALSFLPENNLQKFIGYFSLLADANHNQKSVKEGLEECLSLTNFHPEVQLNIVFCILNVYKLELNSKPQQEYNPTLLGLSLPESPKCGISRDEELAAVDALFEVLSENISLRGASDKHSKAFNQGILGEFCTTLGTIGGRFALGHEMRQRVCK